ncbi:MAG: Zn-dependent oligopeptidase [Epsilonproteobacteria bacterium]|nr:Zn-dependent oligopeptidase [Campylobacterota bacterium]
MRKINYCALLACVMSMASCGDSTTNKHSLRRGADSMQVRLVQSIDDIKASFPKTIEEIEHIIEDTIKHVSAQLDVIIAIDKSDRTFDNTARAFDLAEEFYHTSLTPLHVLEMLSPEQTMREACHKAIIKLQTFYIEAFEKKPLYQAFVDFQADGATREQLSDEQHYFLTESIKDFERAGFKLPDEQFAQAQALKKELSELSLQFETNIAQDKSAITATEGELDGVDPDYIKTLEKNEKEQYVVKCNYPARSEIMEECHNSKTRERFYRAFQNRAYPANKEVLEKIIAKRDQLAKLLGFESFAALNVDSVMAKTTDRVEQFLDDLTGTIGSKVEKERAEWTKQLPDGVQLDGDGKLKPWDMAYLKNQYKKKHYSYDEREVADYFPVEHALKGVFDIYQEFLDLQFTMLPIDQSWHDQVQLIEVRDRQSKALRGYVLLDLYPRDNKYSHACEIGVVSTKLDKGVPTPALVVVVANFPQAMGDKPALLKYNDLTTFFHEFGHAMHQILGVTEMASFSGTSVKRDFVEMPSQMFEEWLYDKKMLKMVSSHYKTGEQLPDHLIEKIQQLKSFDSGFWIARQAVFSYQALEYFKAGGVKDLDGICKELQTRLLPYVAYEPDAHHWASFGHLTGYGAKYYGYLWSKVFALDMFEHVKREGLLSKTAGQRLIKTVLGRGGSVDPEILLKDFLGRAPSQDAFLKDYGIRS